MLREDVNASYVIRNKNNIRSEGRRRTTKGQEGRFIPLGSGDNIVNYEKV